MAMGHDDSEQPTLFLTYDKLRGLGHPFYDALDRLLREKGFDRFVEGLCEPHYAEVMGRPGLAPGVYFRCLLIGYFEGISSERGIAWRVADSLSLRRFLRLSLQRPTPDHSTISRTRRRLPSDLHERVFTRVLELLAEKGLLHGKTPGIDATTLEANAALRSIVRRDDGRGYREYLVELAKAEGIAEPTREELARLDRKRPKKGSNEEWVHPKDPEAQIMKMKNGSTHLAHKHEQAIDLETGAIVGVTHSATVRPARFLSSPRRVTTCSTLLPLAVSIRAPAASSRGRPARTTRARGRSRGFPYWHLRRRAGGAGPANAGPRSSARAITATSPLSEA